MAKPMYSLMLLLLFIISIITPVHSASIITNYSEIRHIVLYAPAVTSSGTGALTSITLAIGTPGKGRVFFSALPYTELDTQGAARMAAYIASLITGIDFSKYDYFVLIESESPIIGGPSAGALMTIGFISLLGGYQLDQGITITGMINPDGTIGPVGGLKEKLEAVAQAGYRVFLIPFGQRLYQYPVYEERRLPWGIIRSIRYSTIDLVEYGRSLNVSVYEVRDILEACQYFVKTANRPSTSSATNAQYRDYRDVVANETINILSEARNLLNTARDVLSRSRSTTWALLQVSRQLQYLNNTIDQIHEELVKSYPYYAYRKALDTYTNSFYVYWYVMIATGSSSHGELLSYVNESLIEVFNNVFKPLRDRPLEPGEILEKSYPYALFLHAGYMLSQAMQASDYISIFNYVSNAIRDLKELHMFTRISQYITRENHYQGDLGRLPEMINVIYAHSLATSSYISSLISETGYSGGPLNTLNQYMDILSYVPKNDSMGIYGVSAMLIALSIYSIHYFLRTMPQEDIYISQLNLLTTYLNNSFNPISTLYLEIAREAFANNDYDTALHSLSISIAGAQCQLVTRVMMTVENPVVDRTIFTYQLTTNTMENIIDHETTTPLSIANPVITDTKEMNTEINETSSILVNNTASIISETGKSLISQSETPTTLSQLREIRSLAYILAGLIALASIMLAIVISTRRGRKDLITSQPT